MTFHLLGSIEVEMVIGREIETETGLPGAGKEIGKEIAREIKIETDTERDRLQQQSQEPFFIGT